MRPAVLLPVFIALAACGPAKAPTTGLLAAPTQQQQAALMAANNFRNQAFEPPMSFNQALQVAAVRHAGFQAIAFGAAGPPSHYETTDGNPLSPAATSNALFTAVDFGDRIRAENGGADLYNGHVYYEGIASVGMPYAIGDLWNTVYHRLPLCRRHSALFGYGEEDTAIVQWPAANVPDTSGSGVGYGTMETAGSSATTVTSAYWPSQSQFAATSFDPTSEHPNPLDATNSGQSPHMPNDSLTGPPLHVIIPTSQDWSSITVSLAKQASPAITIPVYVLAGYVHPDQDHFQDPIANPWPGSSITVNSDVTAWCWDVELDAGEIFILPVDPLTIGTGYQWSVTAVTTGGAGADHATITTALFQTP